jgi:hypothetical protein
MKRLLLMLLLVTVAAVPASAELAKGAMKPGAILGLSMPMGDFGDDKGNDAAAATMGFALGGVFDYALSSGGLIWTSSLTVIRNGFDEDLMKQGLAAGVDVDAGSWMNIPIMTGLKYETAVSPTIDLYGEGLLGLDFFMPPSADLSLNNVTAEWNSDSGTTFGFEFGGGVVINDKFIAGLKLYMLGSPDIEGTIEQEGQADQDVEGETSISMVLIHGGIRF